MKAIILCGGKGSRLKQYTNDIPKALVDINGKTLTEHVIELLTKAGARDVVLAVGHMKDKVKDYFQYTVDYVEEETPLGTGGCLKKLGDTEGDFVVVNGDNIFHVDFSGIIDFHKRNGAVATIALTEVDDVSSYGSAKLDGDKISEFVEKQGKGRGWISSGYYLLSPEVFSHLPNKDAFMLETDVWPFLAKQGKLFGFKGEGFWTDVGTPDALDKVKKVLR